VDRFDFVVIGAGPAGEAAANEARRHGASVAVVDRDLFADGERPTDARVVLTLVDGRPVYSDPGVW
jgi:flavin-dependent dehydrogenase